MSAVGSRGGNVRDLDTARDLQAGVKDKRDWSGAIDEQIRVKLVETATVHANDLDGLGVPAEHRNLIGTRMARYANKGWMEPTTERRKVEHPAANGRKNPVYRITPKGWRELTAGVRTGSAASAEGVSNHSPVPGHAACPDPGGARPTGAPTSKESGRATNPPVPSASDQSSPVAVPASQPAAGETLSLLPPPDPEAWAA